MSGIDHDGWYNPWDELKKPELRSLADECEASGGFVFRTGVVHIIPTAPVYDDATDTLVLSPPKYWHVGDGLHFVRFVAPSQQEGNQG